MSKRIAIMGIRGVPAKHGGFETFAEKLSLYLVKRGWDVVVYCQGSSGTGIWTDDWHGVRRIHVPVRTPGALGTILFDYKSTMHAAANEALLLTLGYNTAAFCAAYRLKGAVNLINMDGLEWQREKWNILERTWLWVNERLGCWLGNHLIADHPSIADHLATRVDRTKVSMIPYGGPLVEAADAGELECIGLVPKQYALVIARPEPENSIKEIVEAFSRKKRGIKLVVLGKYEESNTYHNAVLQSAGPEVIFPGAIYDEATVNALRFYCSLYIHGHTVGGTNPSLVEALGAGSAVLAHDNRFNRWVAGREAAFFGTVDDCAERLDQLLGDGERLSRMSAWSRQRHAEEFTWSEVLGAYENLITHWGGLPQEVAASSVPQCSIDALEFEKAVEAAKDYASERVGKSRMRKVSTEDET